MPQVTHRIVSHEFGLLASGRRELIRLGECLRTAGSFRVDGFIGRKYPALCPHCLAPINHYLIADQVQNVG